MKIDEASEKPFQVLVWYSLNDLPQIQSQLVDISEDGLCLSCERVFPKKTLLIVQLQFPHLYPEKTIFQCQVKEQKEVTPNALYHTYVQFFQIKESAKLALSYYLQNKPEKHKTAEESKKVLQESLFEEIPKDKKNRKHIRVPLNLDAEYVDEIEFSMGTLLITDLSLGGAKIISDKEFEFQKKVLLRMKLAKEICSIPIKVCWIHKDLSKNKFVLGVSFDPFYIAEIESIKKYLQTLK